MQANAVEDIKERLNVEDVVGQYVELKRAGRNFKGLCPFHSEKTPSFVVSPERGVYHCFGCNQGGDIFEFVKAVEGVDFRGGMELLARQAGINLDQYDNFGSSRTKEKEQLRKVVALAVKYYQHSLVQNRHALEYLARQRHFNKQTISDFKFGYSPDNGKALVQFLEKRGISKEDIQNAGLMNRYDGDFFRGRVMVTLSDANGAPIGFTARLLEGEGPKYINTPQTLLYDKSTHIYGLDLAKDAIRTEKMAVIVEGNLDVVASHQAGIKNVVATAGTALTIQQLKRLSGLADIVAFAFDNDSAGLQATLRAIPIAQEVGVELTIVTLPGGKDPDDLIQKDPKLWKQAIGNAEYVLDWVLSYYRRVHNLDTAQGKKAFSSSMITVLAGVSDPVEKEHYLQQTAEALDISIEALLRKSTQNERSQQKRSTKQLQSGEAAESVVSQEAQKLMDTYLALLLSYPKTRSSMASLTPLIFPGARRELFTYLQQHPEISTSDLPLEQNFVKILTLKAEALYGDWEETDRIVESINLAGRLVKQQTQGSKSELSNQIREAELAGDSDTARALLREYQALIDKE